MPKTTCDCVERDAVARTIDQYVITPALADAFDTALGLVAEAVQSGVSRGAFLTGSFGSGKGHFMAVLHALLRHEPAARAKMELQPVMARHDAALLDRQILPLAFHLLGADSMEQALFDGYLRQIRTLHPAASLPAVQHSDGLLVDAERRRARVGDETFLETLNGGGETPVANAWSALLGDQTWTKERYDAARAAFDKGRCRRLHRRRGWWTRSHGVVRSAATGASQLITPFKPVVRLGRVASTLTECSTYRERRVTSGQEAQWSRHGLLWPRFGPEWSGRTWVRVTLRTSVACDALWVT